MEAGDHDAALAALREAIAGSEGNSAVLRILEAIRLYGAAHGGRLPNELQEIEVPVPIDPVTGKLFDYEVRDNVARLEGPRLPGWPCRYEIILLTEHKPKGE